MRLDPILDSFYILGSLWGAPVPQACTSTDAVASTILEITHLARRTSPAEVIAFIGVNVVPMDTERVLENQTVLVENGLITALGPAKQVKVPAGAVHVDGRGKYLMPGLADMHYGPSHFIDVPRNRQEKAFADQLFVRFLAHGVTSLRSLSGSSRSSAEQLQRIFANFPVPRMYLAAERIPSLPSAQPDSVAAYISAMKAAGYSHIDADPNLRGNGLTADSLTLEALHRGGFPLATHRHGIPFEHALELGAGGGSVEHLYVFWDSLLGMPGPSAINPAEERQPVTLPMAKVPELVAAIKRAGIWITPSLKCMETAHPHIQGDALAQIVKALQDAGVKMLLGGDGWALSRWSVQKELAALMRAGFTPYQALLTGTRNVAEYFGLLDSTGTVAAGKRADLILLDGNPLADVRHTWMPAGVMIAGEWFDRDALDQRLTASPRLWFEELLRPQMLASWLLKQDFLPYSPVPERPLEQWKELQQRGQRVLTLADSLDRSNTQVYERVLPMVTTELGAIRSLMSSGERATFDLKIQVWLRTQAREGHRVAIPGVAPTP